MKPYFSEVIKVYDGKFFNLPAHIERINHTRRHFFGSAYPFHLADNDIPKEFCEGLVKCRIVYSEFDVTVEYILYKFRIINWLKTINCDTIDYSFKYADRSELEQLYILKETCDDVLIIKNEFVTDTSFSNVVFENSSGLFTPSTCLLSGLKRQFLLDKKVIQEKEIRIEDIRDYQRLYLINAMIDIEDNICIPISHLILI